MHVILGVIKVRVEHLDEFIAHIQEHARHSRSETGCVRFDVLQDEADPQIICLYEAFRTEADLAVHRSQPYYAHWMAMSRDWRDSSSYSRRVLRNLSPADDEWLG